MNPTDQDQTHHHATCGAHKGVASHGNGANVGSGGHGHSDNGGGSKGITGGSSCGNGGAAIGNVGGSAVGVSGGGGDGSGGGGGSHGSASEATEPSDSHEPSGGSSSSVNANVAAAVANVGLAAANAAAVPAVVPVVEESGESGVESGDAASAQEAGLQPLPGIPGNDVPGGFFLSSSDPSGNTPPSEYHQQSTDAFPGAVGESVSGSLSEDNVVGPSGQQRSPAKDEAAKECDVSSRQDSEPEEVPSLRGRQIPGPRGTRRQLKSAFSRRSVTPSTGSCSSTASEGLQLPKKPLSFIPRTDSTSSSSSSSRYSMQQTSTSSRSDESVSLPSGESGSDRESQSARPLSSPDPVITSPAAASTPICPKTIQRDRQATQLETRSQSSADGASLGQTQPPVEPSTIETDLRDSGGSELQRTRERSRETLFEQSSLPGSGTSASQAGKEKQVSGHASDALFATACTPRQKAEVALVEDTEADEPVFRCLQPSQDDTESSDIIPPSPTHITACDAFSAPSPGPESLAPEIDQSTGVLSSPMELGGAINLPSSTTLTSRGSSPSLRRRQRQHAHQANEEDDTLPAWQRGEEEGEGELERSIHSSLSSSGHRVMSSQADVDQEISVSEKSGGPGTPTTQASSQQLSSQIDSLCLVKSGSSQPGSDHPSLSGHHQVLSEDLPRGSPGRSQIPRSQPIASPLPSGVSSHQPKTSTHGESHANTALSSTPSHARKQISSEKRGSPPTARSSPSKDMVGVYPSPTPSKDIPASERSLSQSQQPFLDRYGRPLVAHRWQDRPSSGESSLSPLVLVQPELSLYTPESSTLASGMPLHCSEAVEGSLPAPSAPKPASAAAVPSQESTCHLRSKSQELQGREALISTVHSSAVSTSGSASQAEATPSSTRAGSQRPVASPAFSEKDSSSRQEQEKGRLASAEVTSADVVTSSGQGIATDKEEASIELKSDPSEVTTTGLFSSQGDFHLHLTPSQEPSMSAATLASHSSESQFHLRLSEDQTPAAVGVSTMESTMGTVPVTSGASQSTTCSGRQSSVLTVRGRAVPKMDISCSVGQSAVSGPSQGEQLAKAVSVASGQEQPAAVSRLLADMSEYSGPRINFVLPKSGIQCMDNTPPSNLPTMRPWTTPPPASSAQRSSPVVSRAPEWPAWKQHGVDSTVSTAAAMPEQSHVPTCRLMTLTTYRPEQFTSPPHLTSSEDSQPICRIRPPERFATSAQPTPAVIMSTEQRQQPISRRLASQRRREHLPLAVFDPFEFEPEEEGSKLLESSVGAKMDSEVHQAKVSQVPSQPGARTTGRRGKDSALRQEQMEMSKKRSSLQMEGGDGQELAEQPGPAPEDVEVASCGQFPAEFEPLSTMPTERRDSTPTRTQRSQGRPTAASENVEADVAGHLHSAGPSESFMSYPLARPDTDHYICYTYTRQKYIKTTLSITDVQHGRKTKTSEDRVVFKPTSEPKVKVYYLPVPPPSDSSESDGDSPDDSSGDRQSRGGFGALIRPQTKRKHPSTENDEEDEDKEEEREERGPSGNYPRAKRRPGSLAQGEGGVLGAAHEKGKPLDVTKDRRDYVDDEGVTQTHHKRSLPLREKKALTARKLEAETPRQGVSPVVQRLSSPGAPGNASTSANTAKKPASEGRVSRSLDKQQPVDKGPSSKDKGSAKGQKRRSGQTPMREFVGKLPMAAPEQAQERGEGENQAKKALQESVDDETLSLRPGIPSQAAPKNASQRWAGEKRGSPSAREQRVTVLAALPDTQTEEEFVLATALGQRKGRGGRTPEKQALSACQGSVSALASPEVPLPFTSPLPKSSSKPSHVMQKTRTVHVQHVSPMLKGRLAAGQRVFAKYEDNHFYAGIVMECRPGGICFVHYDDGAKLAAAEEDVMPEVLLPVGQELLVQNTNGYCDPAIVSAVSGQLPGVTYTVDLVKKKRVVKCNRSQVVLTVSHQQSLVRRVDISSAVEVEEEEVEMPPAKRKRPSIPATASHTPKGKSVTPKGKSVTPKGKSEKALLRRSGESRALRAAASPPEESVNIDMIAQDNDLGPLPTDRRLFRGIVFILTGGGSSDDSGDEAREDVVLFKKDHTIAQLKAGGGEVLQEFNAELVSASNICLLIAGKCRRTEKYLLCLAAGLPCVSHVWVRDSCLQNKLFDYHNYLLFAGHGMNKLPVPWSGNRKIFFGLEIMLCGRDKFKNMWQSILKVAGGRAVYKLPTGNPGSLVLSGKKLCNFVMTEDSSTLSDSVAEKAAALNIPIVTREWGVQCLIHGFIHRYDAHALFQLGPK